MTYAVEILLAHGAKSVTVAAVTPEEWETMKGAIGRSRAGNGCYCIVNPNTHEEWFINPDQIVMVTARPNP